MEKRCSKCNISFGCKNEAPGCWCESLQLTTSALQHLKNNYDNCLCPECLQQHAELQSNEEVSVPLTIE